MRSVYFSSGAGRVGGGMLSKKPFEIDRNYQGKVLNVKNGVLIVSFQGVTGRFRVRGNVGPIAGQLIGVNLRDIRTETVSKGFFDI
ncbi:MAG: hypothetical protein KKH83_05860, partial [Candidatus Margulisbacteria bacterium]|nr:hypothetical protein [Candidatus Margulisiibacteriota bacterium]